MRSCSRSSDARGARRVGHLAVLCVGAWLAGCVSEDLAGRGGKCYRTLDCEEGLLCIDNYCSRDLRSQVPDDPGGPPAPPPSADAAPSDASVREGSAPGGAGGAPGGSGGSTAGDGGVLAAGSGGVSGGSGGTAGAPTAGAPTAGAPAAGAGGVAPPVDGGP